MRENEIIQPLIHAHNPRPSQDARSKTLLPPRWIDSKGADGEFRTGTEMTLKELLDREFGGALAAEVALAIGMLFESFAEG